MKRFFTLAEILDARLPDLPGSLSSLKRVSRGWRGDETKFRKADGRDGGGGYEYHFSVLPPSAQARLMAAHAAPADDDRDARCDERKALWARYEALSKTQKQVCETRLRIVEAVEALLASGHGGTDSVQLCAERYCVSAGSVRRWRSRIKGAGREDRLAALAPGYRPTAQTADCHPDAWAVLTADYLRPEKPAFSACYRRMAVAAKERGWAPVPSERALRRRVDREVPSAVQVLARDGKDKARRLYPAQRRTRSHLHAMQAVNMDGHKFDVFVSMPDGRVTRVHLLAIQDLYSGRIVGWRLSDSENRETVRLVIGDMVERFGIPERIVLDNGRAFASKWISGGTPTRFRFKVRDEDPQGLLTMLGIEIVWTTPYSGQSKPIERAFRDLAEGIAKHPFCAGAYTGNKPDAKPDNYGSKAIPFEAFHAHVARGIAEHNARPGRNTEVCAGRSFDQAFEASMADPATLVKWPTEAQRSLWLLAAEQVRAQKGSGAIHLFGNRYWAHPLNGFMGRKVTVRFDPDNLTRDLKVYDLSDKFICDAPCIADAGFFDVDAARRDARLKSAHRKAVQEQQRLHVRMSVDQLAEIYGGGKPAPETKPANSPKVVRLATQPAQPAASVWGEEAEEFFAKAMARVADGDIIDFPDAGESEPTGIGYGSKKSGEHEVRRKVRSRKTAR